MQENITLIVPCFNEANRLPIATIKNSSSNISFVFVDDGSTDNTVEIIRQHFPNKESLVALPNNAGKGEAVRRGILHVLNDPAYSRSEWLGFWDADLAAPLTELNLLLKTAAASQADAVFGSRVQRLGSIINRSPQRHYLGRAFATVISNMLNIRVYDSQCGAKIFSRDAASKVFNDPFISRWIFDVELLCRLIDSHFKVVECPLESWSDIADSKLKVHKALWRVAVDLLRISRKYSTNRRSIDLSSRRP